MGKKPIDHAGKEPDKPEGTPFREADEKKVREVDPTYGVPEALKNESNAIIVRGLFKTSTTPTTLDELAELLDETVGVNGWGCKFEAFGVYGVTCRLIMKIGGQWVDKCGVAYPDNDKDARERTRLAVLESMLAAARLFGIGRSKVAAAASMKEAEQLALSRKAEADKPKDTPNPQPKKEEARELSADEKIAKAEELKKAWTAHISTCAGPDDLNKLLKGSLVKSIPEFCKGAVFNHIKSQAKELSWQYDPKTMTFYTTNSADPETIPW